MENEKKTSKFYAFHSEELIVLIYNLLFENKKILDNLKENRYRASDIPVSRRVLSHWRTLNIFDVYGDNPEQINLNFVALFWLQLVSELRIFGFSLDKIDNIKKELFSDPEWPIVELYIYLALSKKELDLFILISPEGEVVVGSKNEIDVAEAFGLIEKNYIKINFHILLNRIIKRKIDIIQQPIQSFLSKKEFNILGLIRDGEYKEVILKFNNGAVTHISKKSLEENPDPVKELKKIISSGEDFCNITIKRANGKFVVMEKDIMEKT